MELLWALHGALPKALSESPARKLEALPEALYEAPSKLCTELCQGSV